MKMFPIVILCGGLSTRLGNKTKNIPKSLIRINNKPFIIYQLELLEKNKFENVYLCLGHFGKQIIECLKNYHFKLNIQYSFDGKKLLGTGGSIINCLHLLSDSFFVVYGDSFLDCNYSLIQKQFIKSKQLALMTIYKNNNNFNKSNIIYRDGKIIDYNKSHINVGSDHIDYGCSIFNKKAFDGFSESFDLSEVFKKMLQEKQLSAYLMKSRFYEVGSFQGIKDFEKMLEDKNKNVF